jgi:hypothetical protein
MQLLSAKMLSTESTCSMFFGSIISDSKCFYAAWLLLMSIQPQQGLICQLTQSCNLDSGLFIIPVIKILCVCWLWSWTSMSCYLVFGLRVQVGYAGSVPDALLFGWGTKWVWVGPRRKYALRCGFSQSLQFGRTSWTQMDGVASSASFSLPFVANSSPSPSPSPSSEVAAALSSSPAPALQIWAGERRLGCASSW